MYSCLVIIWKELLDHLDLSNSRLVIQLIILILLCIRFFMGGLTSMIFIDFRVNITVLFLLYMVIFVCNVIFSLNLIDFSTIFVIHFLNTQMKMLVTYISLSILLIRSYSIYIISIESLMLVSIS